MATASEVLSVARKEIGVTEYPYGSNNVKYNTWYYGHAVSGDAYPWCMVFVQWVLNRAGVTGILRTAGCTPLYTWSKANGMYVKPSNMKPGDIVLFCGFDSIAGDADHTGFFEKYDSNGNYICIEGNTSLTSDDNGGAVMRRCRQRANILGGVRPKYEGDEITVVLSILRSGSKGVQVKTVQRLLNDLYYTDSNGKKLKVDAEYGTKTIQAVKKFQKKRGITVDGIFGSNSWSELLKGKH